MHILWLMMGLPCMFVIMIKYWRTITKTHVAVAVTVTDWQRALICQHSGLLDGWLELYLDIFYTPSQSSSDLSVEECNELSTMQWPLSSLCLIRINCRKVLGWQSIFISPIRMYYFYGLRMVRICCRSGRRKFDWWMFIWLCVKNCANSNGASVMQIECTFVEWILSDL